MQRHKQAASPAKPKTAAGTQSNQPRLNREFMCYDASIDFLHSLLPSMPRLTEEIRKYIGMETDQQFACDPVERIDALCAAATA